MIDNKENSVLRKLGSIFNLIGIGFVLLAVLLLLISKIFGKQLFMLLCALVFFIVGIIFLIVGIVCHSIYKTNYKKKSALIVSNKFVMAEIIDIDLNLKQVVRVDNISVNPYFILCRYVDSSGNEYKFKSRGLLYNPSGLIKSNKLRVYVDLANPKRYYVDTNEILPEKAILHKFKFDSNGNSEKLLQNGKFILATTCGVELLGRIRVNSILKPMFLKLPRYLSDRLHVGTDEKGRTYLAYSVLCRYDAPDGSIHIFASKGAWEEPEREYVGDVVKVYYAGKDYKRYHVDLNSLQ